MSQHESMLPTAPSPDAVFELLLDAANCAFIGESGLVTGYDDVIGNLEAIKPYLQSGMFNENQEDTALEIAERFNFDLTIY